MNWFERWMEQRRIESLKRKVAKLRSEAEEAELIPLMPAMETISRRIRLERLDLLEKAVEQIDRRAVVE
jgi:hypothetical protein